MLCLPQGIFFLALQAAWLSGQKHEISLIPLTQSRKSPFDEQEPASTPSSLLGARVGFLATSCPGSIAPAPSIGLASSDLGFRSMPRGDLSPFRPWRQGEAVPSLDLASSGLSRTRVGIWLRRNDELDLKWYMQSGRLGQPYVWSLSSVVPGTQLLKPRGTPGGDRRVFAMLTSYLVAGGP